MAVELLFLPGTYSTCPDCHGDHALSPSVAALLVRQVSGGGGAGQASPREERAERARAQLERLTERELEVLRLVAGGLSAAQPVARTTPCS